MTNVGPSVVLYNNAFSQFVLEYSDMTKSIEKRFLDLAVEFSAVSSHSYNSEKNRQKPLNDCFEKYLSWNIQNYTLDFNSCSRPDGLITVSVEKGFITHNYPVLFLELKNEIGLGNCDPYLQAAWSYAKWWTSGSNGKFSKKHTCPCFLVCINDGYS